MIKVTERRRNVLTGAISLLLVIGLGTIGIKSAFGAFDGGYQLVATFDSAGQGLIEGSDVKIRGINVGEVDNVHLVDGRAQVRLKMKDSERVPRSAEAVVRPKTLFGEKFVDVVPGDLEGSNDDADYYQAGDTIKKTTGGFELERVLSDAYPLLKAIDSSELFTVIDQLAKGGEGLGSSINRQIVNSEKLTDIGARHDKDTQQFLSDLANLSDELAGRAEDLVAGARDLNVALPVLNDRGDELEVVLEQASRLAGDLADLLEANRGFLHDNVVHGGDAIQVLYDHRAQVVPLVKGLRQYVQTLSEAVRIQLDDGTLMAAVKGLLGGDVCGPVACNVNTSGAAAAGAGSGPPNADGLLNGLRSLLENHKTPAATTDGIVNLVNGLLGGPR
jgi:virulence factor Mce-like protein